MKKITFRIDDFLLEEMNKVLEETNTKPSSFIRACIIEKLVRMQVEKEDKK